MSMTNHQCREAARNSSDQPMVELRRKCRHLLDRKLITGLLLVAGTVAGAPVHAVDFDGYYRAGPGGTTANASRACYNLGIDAGHYRLGNECDFYGEFGLAHTATVDGVEYTGKVMINQSGPGTDIGESSASFEQLYLEGKGFDVAPNVNFWAGKRFYGRSDVHIVDQKYIQLDGVGAGVDNILIGIGNFGIAWFTSDSGNGFGDNGVGTSTNPAQRLNLDLTKIAINPDGELRVTGSYTKGNFDDATDGVGTDGYGLSFEHVQTIDGIGGKNTLWLQYAQGSAGLNGNFGTSTTPDSVCRYRVVDSVDFQLGKLGGQTILLFGHVDNDDVNAVNAYDEVSAGGRLAYGFTRNFKLLFEAGYMEKRPDNEPTQHLTKYTLGPSLSTGPGLMDRPELRFYVTNAQWNDAANAASPGGLTGLGDGRTSGTSYGAQAEIWF